MGYFALKLSCSVFLHSCLCFPYSSFLPVIFCGFIISGVLVFPFILHFRFRALLRLLSCILIYNAFVIKQFDFSFKQIGVLSSK